MATATKKKVLTKSALHAHFAEKTGLKKTEIAAVLDLLAETAVAQLSSKGAGVFTIPGLARFKVRKVKAVKGGVSKINPITKEPYITKDRPAHNKVGIRPVKAFAESLK